MDIKLSQCFVAVDDHGGALAFHPDVLGPEVRDCAFRDPAGNMLRFVQARAR
ncbi:hypothetical protein SAMN05192584_12146 [Streptomyces pini]|uniref:Uncharacterized protein n=1 Tax=Streptomyces pini TaxID=1520580 RepID=A0A1I4IP67_9ACTN|nr:hypothetical protein [Streptomyces pini]SFL55566.1 hypothetical protein SAMN05192584_12146 [Streptomyces pini]